MRVPDEEIMARSLVDRAAFAELYDRYQRTVYRYAARRLGAQHADDIVSETFLVAYARRKDFAGGDSAQPWLMGIATKLMSKHGREEARAWKGMQASDLARVSTDQFEAADARLDAQSLARRLGKAIARLPLGDRDVLLLHALGELNYEGIARALDIPIGTVRSRLNRARRKLRTALGDAISHEMEKNHGRTFAPAPNSK